MRFSFSLIRSQLFYEAHLLAVFSGSKVHFQNLEVRCDWSTRGGGTRDESLRVSAWEATTLLIGAWLMGFL